MKFVLFVEGKTEELGISSFIRSWLNSRLVQNVGVHTLSFHGAGDLINEAPGRAKRFLNSPKQDVIAVISLLDLYGLPLPFPAGITSVPERIAWATRELEQRVDETQFRQFFAVHETEAWLLSDTSVFPDAIATSLKEKTKSPEKVNFDTPPSKLLSTLYRSKMQARYDKKVVGSKLLRDLDTETACSKCPYLKSMLDTMLTLARNSGERFER